MHALYIYLAAAALYCLGISVQFAVDTGFEYADIYAVPLTVLFGTIAFPYVVYQQIRTGIQRGRRNAEHRRFRGQ